MAFEWNKVANLEADEVNCYGGKPLHWASEHAPAAVRVLLECGANVNSRNRKVDSEFYGMTPLILNATRKEDCAEVTAVLLQAGADFTAVDANGKTALDHAEAYGLQRIAGVLRGARRLNRRRRKNFLKREARRAAGGAYARQGKRHVRTIPQGGR